MPIKQILIPKEKIEQGILLIRSQKIMLDTDLALLYQVKTFRLNEAVRRNSARFPEDFMFRLTQKEKEEVIANCDHLNNLKFSSQLPCAFTEQGLVSTHKILPPPEDRIRPTPCGEEARRAKAGDSI